MTLLTDVNLPGSQEDVVSNWEPAHSLVEDAVSGAELAAAPCLLALAVAGQPLCLQGGRALCGSQSWKARGCFNFGPRDRIFHQTVRRFPVANHVFLGSWMVDICQECHSLRSAPQKRHMAHLGLCSCGTPGKPSSRDQGGE